MKDSVFCVLKKPPAEREQLVVGGRRRGRKRGIKRTDIQEATEPRERKFT